MEGRGSPIHLWQRPPRSVDRPDHDTICDFRVRNEKAITQSFLQVLLLAKEMKVLKVGTVSIDGTKIKANASINKSIRYDRARDLETQLKLEIDELMKKAADSENMPGEEGESLGAEIQRLEDLRTKMAKAREKLEERAKAKAEKEKEVYENKVKRREERKGSAKGCEIKPPKDTPEPSDQVNLTDHESRIMRKSKHSEYTQSYNAQAVVDSEGSMLVLGARVTNNSSDSNELSLDVASVPARLGGPKTVLADKGFASQDPVGEVQQQGIEVLVSVTKESDHNRRKHDWRPLILAKPAPKGFPHHKAWIKKMMTDMETDRARGLYKLRKQTVEPVFGIIKHVLGFRQFLLRGLEKTNLEWTLVTCAYNLKRLAVLR